MNDKLLAEHLPPLSGHEAIVEANRCLFCFDAPCTHACPTHINIPRFIKKISTDNLIGSARTILESNLLGATCSRVCPVEELCEGACVLGSEHKPIMIGRLQRFAMDHVYNKRIDVFHPAAPTGSQVAVIGAGPAGLSCAGELARLGHCVTIFEKRRLPGGLSTHGIIVLREPVEVALEEVEMIKRLGVTIETGVEAGVDIPLAELRGGYSAIFIGAGLGSVPHLGIPGEELIEDGLAYIEKSKLQPGTLTKQQDVVVIGAGNTAIDCATIAKRLGTENVTIVYRRTDREMTAYDHEYAFIKNEGVTFRFRTQPVRVIVENAVPAGLECVRMDLMEPDASGRPAPRPIAGSEFVIPARQIIRAIGQYKPSLAQIFGLATDKGLIRVDHNFETSIPAIYSGGDCIRAKGSASTVMAVEDGKRAAQSIHQALGASHG